VKKTKTNNATTLCIDVIFLMTTGEEKNYLSLMKVFPIYYQFVFGYGSDFNLFCKPTESPFLLV